MIISNQVNLEELKEDLRESIQDMDLSHSLEEPSKLYITVRDIFWGIMIITVVVFALFFSDKLCQNETFYFLINEKNALQPDTLRFLLAMSIMGIIAFVMGIIYQEVFRRIKTNLNRKKLIEIINEIHTNDDLYILYKKLNNAFNGYYCHDRQRKDFYSFKYFIDELKEFEIIEKALELDWKKIGDSHAYIYVVLEDENGIIKRESFECSIIESTKFKKEKLVLENWEGYKMYIPYKNRRKGE